MFSSLDKSPASEAGIHPIAVQMRDIILARAADGQPTMKEDLAPFTRADISIHFPAAKALANNQIVRQLDDGRGFESRAQLLTRAKLLLLGKLPQTFLLLRRATLLLQMCNLLCRSLMQKSFS